MTVALRCAQCGETVDRLVEDGDVCLVCAGYEYPSREALRLPAWADAMLRQQRAGVPEPRLGRRGRRRRT